MGLLRRDKKKDEDEEYMQNLALTEQGRQTLPEDQLASLGRSVYMIMDPEVTAILNPVDAKGRIIDDPKLSQFRSLIPAFSHLNRTTNIDKRDATLLMLDYEYLDIIHTLNMKEDNYENEGWALLESLKIFARNIVADSFHGWKGRIMTEQIKIIKTEIEKKKKGILR